MRETSGNIRYYGIQALRGLAAISVLLFHAAKMVREKLDGPPLHFAAGAGGVDIFFAISGFVMIITTARSWGNQGLWLTFLQRRLLRIMPLYWLMTAIMLSLLAAMPHLSEHTILRPWHSIASFLLIPAWNTDHEAFPLLVVGWTLSFEMLFYLMFTIALALRIHPARWVSVMLFMLAALSLLRTDAWGAPASLINPLLLEFIFSMWIGMATLKGHRLPVPMAAVLAPGMLVLMLATCLLPMEDCFTYRVIFWGVPGAILVASVIALEEKLRPYISGLPSLLGDASYAIYLSHSFVVTFVSIVLIRLHLPHGITVASGFAGTILLALAVGVAIHLAVERPLIAALRSVSFRPLRLAFSNRTAT